MNKFTALKKILYVATMPAFLCLSMAPCPSFNTMAAEEIQAVSATTNKQVTLSENDFSLFLPAEYEQYLSLTDIKSLAVQDDYIAIADGNTIFLYNGKTYTTYTHTQGDVIGCDFGYDGNLWFWDEGGNLYSVNPAEDDKTATALSSSPYNAFTVTDDGAFGAFTTNNGTTIYTVSAQSGSEADKIATAFGSITVPVMRFENNVLYCAYDTKLFTYTLNGTNSETHTYRDFPADATDMTVENGIIHCVNSDGLYEVTLSDAGTEVVSYSLLERNSSFTRLAQSGNKLYIAEQESGTDTAKIKLYDLQKRQFTDYEIGSSSDAPNRLKNAQTAVSCGNRLLVADENRIVIYDGEKGTYSAFSLPFTPEYLASNGTTILVATGKKYAVYTQDGAPMSEGETENNITGIAAEWGGDYYVSYAPQNFIRISADTLKASEPFSLTLKQSITDITADPFGRIYVKDLGGNIYRYTEKELLAKAETEVYATLPATSNRLTADMRGGVYASDDKNIYYADGTSSASYAIEQNKLFGADGTLRSFALDSMDGDVYFLYEDYILRSSALPVPSLNKLVATDAYSVVYTPASETTMVKIVADTLCISFDVSRLTAESEYFADCAFVRYEEVNAVLLAEITIDGSAYSIVAPAGADTLALVPFPAESCKTLDKNEYLTATDFTNNAGYLTNDVSLYKYPYLSSELTYGKLAKGTQVTVGDRFTTGDGDFLYVTVGEQSGYIPASYVSRNDGKKAEYSVVRYETLHTDRAVTAYADDGTSITLDADKDHTVGVCTEEGETLVVCYADTNGKLYYATVQKSDMVGTNGNFLRIFFGILLLLADGLLIINYIYHTRRSSRNRN
jgi:hypothetical protein